MFNFMHDNKVIHIFQMTYQAKKFSSYILENVVISINLVTLS